MSGMFFGGLPTEIDVKKLEEKFGVPDVGQLIAHTEIADVIGVPWKSHRYTSVLNAWRGKLRRNHNVETDVEPGHGMKVLAAVERIDKSQRYYKRGVRSVKVSAVLCTAIDEKGISDPMQIQRLTKTREISARMFMAMANEAKVLAPPKAPQALPRAAAK